MSQMTETKLSWARRVVKAAAAPFLRRMMADAMQSGDMDKLERALRLGANPNARVGAGLTPLTAGEWGFRQEFSSEPHQASETRIKERAQALILWGADVNLPNARGDRPLHAAMSLCSVGLCEALALAGADTELRNSRGQLPAEVACDYTEHWTGIDFSMNAHVIEKKETALAALESYALAYQLRASAAPAKKAGGSFRL